MASLDDHVDRISTIARSIRASAAPPANQTIPGPFTRAIIDTPLGDLIRDIDAAEIGLFTLVTPQQPVIPEVDTGNVEIARVEFLGATPLRKPPAAKQGRGDGARQPREHDPEVYANAALKYLERYQSIRPMPRASEQAARIIEHLEEVRTNIYTLSEQLKQHSGAETAEPPRSPKSAIKQEERAIQDLHSQIQYLRERKEELAKKKARAPLRSKRAPKPPTSPPPTSPPDDHEATFWNTPGATARTLHFTGDSLLDEEVDLANVSTTSFGTPVAPSRQTRSPEESFEEEPEGPETEPEPEDGDDEDEVEEALEDLTMEPTVLIAKAPRRTPSPEPTPPQLAPETVKAPEPSPSPVAGTSVTPQHRQKVRVTTEIERMAEKIWATVGEIIMPGHPFDALGQSTNKSKPPRAKETMAYLQELSTHIPSLSSPSASSFSSLSAPAGPGTAPSAQQVLTAHMLWALLSAPSQSLPFNVLKQAVADKAASVGANTSVGLMGGNVATKTLYNCVAKRLLKIDRGTREQVVKFDL